MKTEIAVSPKWFKGTHVEQIEQIAANGFPPFETLHCCSWEDKEAVRARCEQLQVECGAVREGMGYINDSPLGNGTGTPGYRFPDEFDPSRDRRNG